MTAALVLLVPGTGAEAQDGAMPVPELLADPARWEGEVVAATGYLRPHVLYLFPSRELAEAQQWKSSLIIGDDPSASIRSSPCPARVVTITGTFRQLDPGIYGLIDIQHIRVAGAGEVCWPERAAGRR